MEIAAERWGQLRGNLIPVASETEMVNILRNETEGNSAGVCSSNGQAGGMCLPENLSEFQFSNE